MFRPFRKSTGSGFKFYARKVSKDYGTTTNYVSVHPPWKRLTILKTALESHLKYIFVGSRYENI